MGVIHVLPEHVANKIAAGEVIERPASIVKELIENSLDAGAVSIEISIKNGGKSLIRVSDNGSGMSEEDAKLAFVRHATSKISNADDLERIGSFGFRGEALPSIAAVSRTRLVTCVEGDIAGTEISMEGGKLDYVKGSASRKGTLLEVRDLFFNTPARRKFHKTDTTEMGHIVDTVSNIALSRLDVHFALESSGRKILDLWPTEDLAVRAAALYGEDTAKHLLSFSGQTEGIKVRGLIGKPYVARANRTGQVLFVNQRLVRSTSIAYALQDGYHGLLMQGQFPLSVLFLDLDLTRVDVNVHPTKQEVRISNEPEVKSFLKKTVTERLSREPDLAPHLNRVGPSPFAPQAGYSRAASVDTGSHFRYPEQTTMPLEQKIHVAEPSESILLNAAYSAAQPALAQAADKFKITRILGQIHQTFIVAETEEGLLVIDQHAAHERVMFETLLKNFRESKPESQGLLMQEVLEIHPRQKEILENSLPFLARLGFELEEFGVNAFVIRAYPSIFKDENPVQALKGFIEEKEEGKLQTDLEHREEEIAALIACKRKSVKAYDPLSPAALQALLERLARCDNPFNCPHGRPSFMKLTFADLEKQFKRKL